MSDRYGKTHGDTVIVDDKELLEDTQAVRISKVSVYYSDQFVYGMQFKYEIDGVEVEGDKAKGEGFEEAEDDGNAHKGKIKLKNGAGYYENDYYSTFKFDDEGKILEYVEIFNPIVAVRGFGLLEKIS